MRNQTILLALLASLTASGCKAVECAEGTIERNGMCEPGAASDPAVCGEFTHLEGDRCVPDFIPTECDPDTTTPEVRDGVTVCVGAGGCESEIQCPTPTSATKQTICGRIYDFTLGAPSAATRFTDGTMPMPMVCDPANPATSGPCALTMLAYDAIAFGMNPMTTPRPVGSLTIDKCGRFRLQDVDVNGVVGFVGIGVDDATGLGNNGVTVTTAVAVPVAGMTATKNVEAYIVPKATTDMWTTTGGPPLSGGIYAPVFRAHKMDDGTPQAGVTVTRNSNTIPSADYYFQAAQTTRMNVDNGEAATGANGTALVTGASVAESLAYAGNGGLGAGCKWDPHAGASLSAFGGIVFIQIFRKSDIFGMTCND